MTENIASALSIPDKEVRSVVDLLLDGATIPFIARYRKELTGGLDEVQIGEIKSLYEAGVELEKRRKSILKTIEEQGKLTGALEGLIQAAKSLTELEDLYLPYKQSRKTKAAKAVELGLEPLAKILMAQQEKRIHQTAERFVKNGVNDTDDALAGARDIVAEWISEDLRVRRAIRNLFERQASLNAKVKKAKITEAIKYKDYFDFSERLKRVPSHRFLAIKRGESEGFLKSKIEIDNVQALSTIERLILKPNAVFKCVEQMKTAIADAYTRLLLPSIEKEFENQAKEEADKGAISIFSENLSQLLLSPPLGQKSVLAIDPGLRTGCKIVALNTIGDLLEDTVVYPLKSEQDSIKTIEQLITKYQLEAIAIGNGTGGREIESLIKNAIKNGVLADLPLFMVSEQGASIYSASEIAREEFPDKDITVRGAVSIGRRLKDPLAELVKIDPKSIGVGQYQHDVNQKKLKDSLDQVVMSCVNQVGVELNTASKHLLSYVSGLGPVLAQNIVDYRSENGKFTSRSELKKVPRLGSKAFEQCAGFLRIHGAKNPLDNSAVHPETYGTVAKIAADLKVTVAELMQNTALHEQIDKQKYLSNTIGLITITDILNELAKPGRDPRAQLEAFEFANVNSIQELSVGMVLPGTVTNITAFGCFVDVGVHQDGLVHISQITNRFIKDPNEVVTLNQKVQVRVTEVDIPRKRIGLSMKEV